MSGYGSIKVTLLGSGVVCTVLLRSRAGDVRVASSNVNCWFSKTKQSACSWRALRACFTSKRRRDGLGRVAGLLRLLTALAVTGQSTRELHCRATACPRLSP
ncbi:hypothetical protein M758_UG025000 [Ceratodon purpureus]|nr:hypothetical protein M758_UG025000 [Ceratodon purpureus]